MFKNDNTIFKRIMRYISTINLGGVKMLDRIALFLLIVGGVNWGLIGVFKFDLVGWLFGGQGAFISRIVYTLVAISALWCVSLFFKSNALLDRD